MSWWRGITSVLTDVGLRVAAVGLALLFIVHARAEVQHETVIEVGVRLRHLPERLVVATEIPERVEVRVRGTINALTRLRLAAPEIDLDLAEARPGEVVQRRLTVGEVRLPVRSPVQVLEIVHPRIIPVGVDERAMRDVRVLPAVSGTVPAGLTFGGPPSCDPPQVSVTGPRRLVEALDVVRTAPVDISTLRVGESVDVPLETLPGVLLPTPARVRLLLNLDTLAEETFRGVPIVVLHNRAVDRGTAEPARVSVTLRGSRSLLALVRPASIEARVDARNLLSGRHFLVIEVGRPGEGLTVVSVTPDHAEVALE